MKKPLFAIIGTPENPKQKNPKLLVRMAGIEIYLTHKSFEVLSILARARKSGINDGWVHCEELQPGLNQARYLWRMKSELRAAGLDIQIENDRAFHYRLGHDPDSFGIAYANLIDYPDARVRGFAESQYKEVPA